MTHPDVARARELQRGAEDQAVYFLSRANRAEAKAEFLLQMIGQLCAALLESSLDAHSKALIEQLATAARTL